MAAGENWQRDHRFFFFFSYFCPSAAAESKQTFLGTELKSASCRRRAHARCGIFTSSPSGGEEFLDYSGFLLFQVGGGWGVVNSVSHASGTDELTLSPVLPKLRSDSLEPTYHQLQKMKLDKSPFVVVSVIGQELLTHGFHGAAVVVLEAGLKIGTCSLKLRGSVFSALSSAYWSLGNAEKSMAYMQQDLEVTKTLGTEGGEGGGGGGGHAAPWDQILRR